MEFQEFSGFNSTIFFVSVVRGIPLVQRYEESAPWEIQGKADLVSDF